MKHSFELELKNFNKSFNQNKEIIGIQSSKYQYGAYKWSLYAKVNKCLNQENGDLWLVISLFCETDHKSNFPLFARMKYSILNKDKDIRRAFSRSGCT